ncbi:MAG: transglutaminase-like domain-containing protein [Patescibacteria group bacterium]|nr:transglutaminase-like domain-containing protein [Patescibacteria group bacterium]
MTKKIIYNFLLTVFFFLFSSQSAWANDFASFYKTTYEFAQNGEATVFQEISLVNQTADFYVSEYALSIVGGQVYNVEAYDKIGALRVKTTQKEKTVILSTAFNEKIVGKGQMLSFILKYKVRDLAKKEGNLWQISLPKLANYQDIEEYNVDLKIPGEFGRIAFVNPSPRKEEMNENFTLLSFKKDDLIKYGVLVSLGQYQTFDFNLYYDLVNPTDKEVIEKITIPPDTPYQTVFFGNISPLPLQVSLDEDGNWFADFLLAPNQKLKVEVAGQADIFGRPKTNTTFDFNGNPNDYLEPTKYWETLSPEISEKAKELKSPEKIFDFVAKTLNYQYDNLGQGLRQGAVAALKNPDQAVCSEFTDLFIALCRAAGIPARELEGFAYTDNPKLNNLSLENDLLHSWPEYYDKIQKQWLMVDPTWANTTGGLDYFNKFDLNHFVFVIHGKNDAFPYPPGSYREKNSSNRQIFVSMSKEAVTSRQKILAVEELNPGNIWSLKGNLAEAKIRNLSGFAIYNLKLFSEDGKVTPSSWQYPVVLPFSVFEQRFNISPKDNLTDYSLNLNFTADDQTISLRFKVFSLLQRGLLLGSVMLIILMIFILRSFRKHNLQSKTNQC